LDFVDLTELSDGLKEFIRGACFLWFEECQPEDLSIAALELAANVFDQAVVDNVFEINRVKFVSPWVKNLEALMVHVLCSESLDILLDEFKISLICLDRI